MTPQVAGLFKALDAMDKAGTPLRTAFQMQRLAEALRLAMPIIDSFLNGQGAVTTEDMDAALMAAQDALAEYEASHA